MRLHQDITVIFILWNLYFLGVSVFDDNSEKDGVDSWVCL